MNEENKNCDRDHLLLEKGVQVFVRLKKASTQSEAWLPTEGTLKFPKFFTPQSPVKDVIELVEKCVSDSIKKIMPQYKEYVKQFPSKKVDGFAKVTRVIWRGHIGDIEGVLEEKDYEKRLMDLPSFMVFGARPMEFTAYIRTSYVFRGEDGKIEGEIQPKSSLVDSKGGDSDTETSAKPNTKETKKLEERGGEGGVPPGDEDVQKFVALGFAEFDVREALRMYPDDKNAVATMLLDGKMAKELSSKLEEEEDDELLSGIPDLWSVPKESINDDDNRSVKSGEDDPLLRWLLDEAALTSSRSSEKKKKMQPTHPSPTPPRRSRKPRQPRRPIHVNECANPLAFMNRNARQSRHDPFSQIDDIMKPHMGKDSVEGILNPSGHLLRGVFGFPGERKNKTLFSSSSLEREEETEKQKNIQKVRTFLRRAFIDSKEVVDREIVRWAIRDPRGFCDLLTSDITNLRRELEKWEDEVEDKPTVSETPVVKETPKNQTLLSVSSVEPTPVAAAVSVPALVKMEDEEKFVRGEEKVKGEQQKQKRSDDAKSEEEEEEECVETMFDFTDPNVAALGDLDLKDLRL